MNPQQTRTQRIRVAVFVTASLALLIAAIIVLGQAHRLFSRKVTLHSTFTNTGGLVSGAAVRLAGVDVGLVKAIHFDPKLNARRVDVDLSVGSQYLERLRTDSVAQIASKGLLGDMIVDITLGNEDKPQLKDGDHIETVETASLGQIVGTVGDAIKKLDVLIIDVDTELKSLLTPQVTTDFQRIVHSAAAVVEGVEHGKGFVHSLIYDPALADATGKIVLDMQRIVARANTSITDLQGMLSDARTGDGLIHGLIYDKRGGQAIGDVQRVAADFASIADQVKSGPSLVHSLLYDKDKTNLVENLNEASRIFRRIAEETDQGKGTIGGLLKDPTVYQDLTAVLENLKRNELLKALVRYTIVKDNLNRPGRVAVPAADSSAP